MSLEIARNLLTEALRPHIKGKNAAERLEKAVDDALASVSHMLSVREVGKKRLGATVMTESASARKAPGSIPRNI